MLIELNNIPSDMFINVERVCDVYSAEITQSDTVNLTSKTTGERSDTTRKDFVKSYRFLNGRKVIMQGCKRNTPYSVSKEVKGAYQALYIPKGNTLRFSDGGETPIDRDSFVAMDTTPHIIERNMFHFTHTYAEPMGQVLERLRPMGIKSKPKTGHNKVRVSLTKEVTVDSTPSVTRYKAVARYMHNGSLVGFEVISDTGDTKRFKFDTAAKLAKADRIVNLIYSEGDNTRAYFRGKGMTLEDIPVRNI